MNCKPMQLVGTERPKSMLKKKETDNNAATPKEASKVPTKQALDSKTDKPKPPKKELMQPRNRTGMYKKDPRVRDVF